MTTYKRTLFKLNGEVIIEEKLDLDLEDIDNIKTIISEEFECKIDEIEVVFDEVNDIVSDIDVTVDGLMSWKDIETKIMSGIKLDLMLGSNEHLDAINTNTIDKYLKLI